MSLKQKNWLCTAVLAVGLLLAVFGNGGVPGGIGFVLVIAGLVLDVALCRCPHCGVWLGKYPGTYCKNCGEEIDWSVQS